MKKIKRISKTSLLIVVLFLFTLSVAIGIITRTFALYKQDAAAENYLYSKNLEVNLIDQFDASGLTLPGDTLNKDVYMKNLGEVPAVVRIKLSPTWLPASDEAGRLRDVAKVEITYGATQTTDWVLKPDGWYYYTKILMPGQQTTYLVESLKFLAVSNDTHATDYSEATYTLNVDAQSIQAISVAAQETWGYGFTKNTTNNTIQWITP